MVEALCEVTRDNRESMNLLGIARCRCRPVPLRNCGLSAKLWHRGMVFPQRQSLSQKSKAPSFVVGDSGAKKLSRGLGTVHHSTLLVTKSDLDANSRVHAECNSVLHSARPRVLHSAGGPYITFMTWPMNEDFAGTQLYKRGFVFSYPLTVILVPAQPG